CSLDDIRAPAIPDFTKGLSQISSVSGAGVTAEPALRVEPASQRHMVEPLEVYCFQQSRHTRRLRWQSPEAFFSGARSSAVRLFQRVLLPMQASTRREASDHGPPPQVRSEVRNVIARSFSWVEDIMYVALGVLLAASAVVLLGSTAFSFARQLFNGTLPGSIVEVLDRLLLVLMIVELLYTVQVSFREHALVPEPFLIVGLVAATRRILVLTAEFSRIPTSDVSVFRSSM